MVKIIIQESLTNNCKNVIPVNSAVPNKKGVVLLNLKEREFKCESESLIEIFENSNKNHNYINFMKMDIEGKEKFVILLNL